ncbi:hypothetical protein O6P43_002496 [Quillaja saponaria]|uniref:Uncharacterized protein n=1 Tax=Quillaja saponaria TaxID=32244 RepID=A0AAD7QD31_QUISA|nr:hypothetical protein O6P43_002496 [Quillaja saponaria]
MKKQQPHDQMQRCDARVEGSQKEMRDQNHIIDELTRKKENLNKFPGRHLKLNGGVHGVAILVENLCNSSRFSPYYSNSSISFPYSNNSSDYHPEYGGNLHVYQPYLNPYSPSPSASSCPSFQSLRYQTHQNLHYTSPYTSPYSWDIPCPDSVLPQIQPPICHPLDFEKNEIENLVDGDQLLASTGNKENSRLNDKDDGIIGCMDNLGVPGCMSNEMAQDFYGDHQCVGEADEGHNRVQTRTLQSKIEVPCKGQMNQGGFQIVDEKSIVDHQLFDENPFEATTMTLIQEVEDIEQQKDVGFWKKVQKIDKGGQFESLVWNFKSKHKAFKVAVKVIFVKEIEGQLLKWVDYTISTHIGAQAMMAWVYAISRQASCRKYPCYTFILEDEDGFQGE